MQTSQTDNKEELRKIFRSGVLVILMYYVDLQAVKEVRGTFLKEGVPQHPGKIRRTESS